MHNRMPRCRCAMRIQSARLGACWRGAGDGQSHERCAARHAHARSVCCSRHGARVRAYMGHDFMHTCARECMHLGWRDIVPNPRVTHASVFFASYTVRNRPNRPYLCSAWLTVCEGLWKR